MARWYRHFNAGPPVNPEKALWMRRQARRTAALVTLVVIAGACAGASKVSVEADPSGSDAGETATADDVTTTTSTTTTTAPVDAGPPSDERTLEKATTITEGDLSPKSVVSSGDGLFFAQNMIYSHNIGRLRPQLLAGEDHPRHRRPARRSASMRRPERSRAARSRPRSRTTAPTPMCPTTRWRGPATPTPVPTSVRRATGTTRSSTGSTPGPSRSTRSSRSARCPSSWRSRPTTPPCSSPTGADTT